MDSGQIVIAYSLLVLGAAAAFGAIVLWSKTGDAAWRLVAAGTIIAYINIVYSMLNTLGAAVSSFIATMLLSVLPLLFFIAAFWLVIVRSRHQLKQ